MLHKSAILAVIMAAPLCLAQAPAGAPAGSTALCNDGTYAKGSSKLSACLGHKGVKTWYGAPAKTSSSAKTASSAPAKTAASSPAPASSPSSPAPSAPAAQTKTASSAKAAAAPPSASDIADAKSKGLVWVNLNTKVYHYSGVSTYGTTKNGKFMSEADAKAAGYRAAKDAPAKSK